MLLIKKAAAIAAATLLACGVAQADTTQQQEPVARIYLHPAAPAGKGQQAATISPVQLNSILAHHFDVPGEALGLGAADRAAWEYLPDEVHSGKEAAKQLFDQVKHRTAVLITGLRDEDAQEVMPAAYRNTHDVVTHAQVSSYNVHALLHSYGERLFGALPGTSSKFPGFTFDAAPDKSASSSTSVSDLLSQAQDTAASCQSKGAADSDICQKSLSFFDGLYGLVNHYAAVAREEARANSPYTALRIDGLADIRNRFGADSAQYGKAKQLLRDVLHSASRTTDLPTLHQTAFVIMSDNTDGAHLAKRSDPAYPFRSATALTPFLKSRALNDEEVEARQDGIVGHFDSDIGTKITPLNETVAKKPKQSDAPKQPKERDYTGKCFKSEDDLNSATANCYGHGDAYQTSKGGKKCYRCKCKTTKDSKGKTTQWAGDACQKIDISKEFVLIGTTTIVLIVVALGSVLYLLYDGQQELPSVLAGISIPNK